MDIAVKAVSVPLFLVVLLCPLLCPCRGYDTDLVADISLGAYVHAVVTDDGLDCCCSLNFLKKF